MPPRSTRSSNTVPSKPGSTGDVEGNIDKAPTAACTQPVKKAGNGGKKRTLDTQDITNPDPAQSNEAPPKKSKTGGKKALAVAPNDPGDPSGVTPDEPAKPKRKRRTKLEMQAAREAELAAKAQKDALNIERQQKLHRMDVEEDVAQKKTRAAVVRHISELDPSNEGSEEDFPGFYEVTDSSSDGSDNETEMSLEKLQAGYKALQLEVKRLKGKPGSKSGEKKGNCAATVAPKAITFASGLAPGWDDDDQDTLKASGNQQLTVSERGLGGKGDEQVQQYQSDVGDEEKGADNGKRKDAGRLRKNQLVAIAEEDDDNVEFVPAVAQRATRKTSRKAPAARNIQLPKTDSRASTPAPIKAEPKRSTTPAQERAKGEQKTIKPVTSNSVRVNDLLDFAIPDWRSLFLPTLYDKFFASGKPFSDFFKGTKEFVGLLQEVVDEVYTADEYKVTSVDAIHALAYNRINEKRSQIGKSAIELVKQHVSTMNDDNDVKLWAQWALRPDGPLFYRKPVPINSPILKRTDPNYTPPEGRLLSKFIISIASPTLRLKKGSVSDNGYPRGLVSLIMAALERAVKALLKPKEVKEFSNEFWGSKVKSYHTGLLVIDEARWNELLEACGLQIADLDEDVDAEEANFSFLDNERALIFDFGSPVKNRQ